VGDFLRHIKEQSTLSSGLKLEEYLAASKLLPADILIPLLKEKMSQEQKNGHDKFLIDGFPRRLDQLRAFEEAVRTSNRYH